MSIFTTLFENARVKLSDNTIEPNETVPFLFQHPSVIWQIEDGEFLLTGLIS